MEKSSGPKVSRPEFQKKQNDIPDGRGAQIEIQVEGDMTYVDAEHFWRELI